MKENSRKNYLHESAKKIAKQNSYNLLILLDL